MLTRRDCFGLAAGALAAPVLRAQPAFENRPWPAHTPVPALDATDLVGRRWQLADYKGKVLVLNFWASWCPPCRAEMATLQQLPQVFGEDRVAVVGVNYKESPLLVQRFIQGAGLTLQVLMDPQGEVARRWEANKVFPTTVLIDPRGRARQRIRGEVDWSAREALGWLDSLLG